MLCLTACDLNTNVQSPVVEDKSSSAKKEHITEELKAKKLTDVAGQAVVPVMQESEKSFVPSEAQSYIGRYKVTISCDDAFVSCNEGTAEFIINLLEDGSAHRTIIHLGTITYASVKQYNKDRWSYDEKAHQIILHRASGVQFFYNIRSDKSLKMDLNKIANATEVNQKYFREGGALPQKAYVLKYMQ